MEIVSNNIFEVPDSNVTRSGKIGFILGVWLPLDYSKFKLEGRGALPSRFWLLSSAIYT